MSTSRRRVFGAAAQAAAAALIAGGNSRRVEADTTDAVVGAWTVQITSTSAPYAGVQLNHADGTLELTFAPSGPSASGASPRLYAPGYGMWSKMDEGGYDFTLTALSLTADGLYQGQVVVNGHAQLDATAGQTFAATYTSRSSSADGSLVGNNSGTISGTRVTPAT